jgi:hypothetical protein
MTNTAWWLIAAAWLVFASPVLAGNIYVCRGAHGVKTYQNSPCATLAAELKHSAYDDSLSRPGTPVEPSAQSVRQREVYQEPHVNDASSGRTIAAAAPTGYQCTAGRRSWIQNAPCPATYMDSESVDVTGHTVDGQFLQGSGWMPVEKPVQQKSMDSDAFCEKVRAGARIGQEGGSSTSQSYERNKIKRNQCGG